MKEGYVLKADAAKYLTPEPITYATMKRKSEKAAQTALKDAKASILNAAGIGKVEAYCINTVLAELKRKGLTPRCESLALQFCKHGIDAVCLNLPDSCCVQDTCLRIFQCGLCGFFALSLHCCVCDRLRCQVLRRIRFQHISLFHCFFSFASFVSCFSSCALSRMALLYSYSCTP